MLVIGATGGTGRCVVEHALRAGHEVTAFVRTPQKITMQHERLRVAQGDVLQADAMLRGYCQVNCLESIESDDEYLQTPPIPAGYHFPRCLALLSLQPEPPGYRRSPG